jgi:hypothetical protein
MKLTLSWRQGHLVAFGSIAEIAETLACIAPVVEESAKPKRRSRGIGVAMYNSRYAKPALA